MTTLFDQHLTRVTSRIGSAVLSWCRARIATQPLFHLSDLTADIAGLNAPDSPGRILRLLRQNGDLKYKVVNRRKSLYRLEYVS